MALGLTGQFSWQTMQGLFMAQGRQRPRSTKAVPILMGPFWHSPFSQPFIQAEGPDGRRRAKIAAGDAIELAPAGSHAKIENRGPQPFKPPLQARRMNHIGGTDSHALAAFDAAGQKRLFGQGAGGTHQCRIPIPPQTGRRSATWGRLRHRLRRRPGTADGTDRARRFHPWRTGKSDRSSNDARIRPYSSCTERIR
jgi:hypothetical protein